MESGRGVGAEVELAEAVGPSTPASRSCGQWVLSASSRTTSCRVEARVGRQVEDVARRFVGECQGRVRCVSAIQIGKFVMIGPALASSGWPISAIRAASAVVALGGARDPAPNVGRSATEKSSDPKIPSSGPSQATGRSSPAGPDPGDQASSARSAETTSRTWNGPAAWRNVPHVVATGKTRLVTRNVRDS